MQVTGLTKSFGPRTLFANVSFRIGPGDRLAVAGRNGAGKTTLLRILAGLEDADSGSVSIPRGERVALHDQRPAAQAAGTVREYVEQGLAHARDAEDRMAALEARMAGGDHGPATLAEYDRAQSDLEAAGGYHWRAWVERVTRGLGLSDDHLDRPLASLSGGELTRASLARALAGRPQVLLLDEPTNHLDLEAMEWLEGIVRDIGAAVVIVSHDRWFLESTATSVLEIANGRAKVWPMGYSAFRRARAEEDAQQAALADRRRDEMERLERFVTRWRAGTKAKQAKSRARKLERLDPIAAPSREKSLSFGFPKTEKPGRVVLEADELRVEVAGRPLVDAAGFTIERGQRVAVVGPNGAGKTTTVETLLGRREAAAGRVSMGHKVLPSYFTQHAREYDGQKSLAETVKTGTALTETEARTLLGRFLFSGDMADRPVEDLSGGERRRLGLVELVAEGGNLLVLDEPTNHLDVESREALEDALLAYDGTVILVSHDRALIDAVATHTLSLEAGTALMRAGGYGDLLALRQGGAEIASGASAGSGESASRGAGRGTGGTGGKAAKGGGSDAPAGGGARGDGTARRSNGRLAREVSKIESRIAGIEDEMAAVEAEVAGAGAAGDVDEVTRLGERHRQLQEDLSYAMAEWEDRAATLVEGT
ncbi:MAG: ABC-F family ATP-binding cassette domain-containing protein [Actinomycetota bacterium]